MQITDDFVGKHSWEMQTLPGVIITDEQYRRLFWNTMTFSFAKEIPDQGKWIVFFQSGKEYKAIEWAHDNNGQFIHVHESLIKRRITRFERENPEIVIDIHERMLKAMRDLMLFGAAAIEVRK